MAIEMTKATRFGVLFSGNFPLMRAIDGSVLANKLGYDSAWFGEDYFYQGGIATATAVAERTEKVEIGLGILTPLARHPAHVAGTRTRTSSPATYTFPGCSDAQTTRENAAATKTISIITPHGR